MVEIGTGEEDECVEEGEETDGFVRVSLNLFYSSGLSVCLSMFGVWGIRRVYMECTGMG